jgi:competence protein ComEC
MVAAVVGALAARNGTGITACPAPEIGRPAVLEGRFLAAPRAGAAPFRPADGCPPVTVVTRDGAHAAGVPLRLHGSWMAGRHRPWFREDGPGGRADASGGSGPAARGSRDPGSAPVRTPGEIGLAPVRGPGVIGLAPGRGPGEIGWAAVRWRDRLVVRIDRLYGARGPLVAALTLARREGMDRDLSERFARTGIAHLLAISGFHVGVIAGAALALLRLARVERRRAGLGAAALAWLYVGLIGFPDAACRAALILGLVAASRARGRPPARWGALSTALLVLLAVDPSKLASPGFQLSFLGAAGLVAWSRPFTEAVLRASGRRCPRGLASGLGAGAAATLATLPVVGWHFERVSLVGIPVTLFATPLVSLALPGAILSILVDPVSPALAAFLAGGVDALLGLLEGGTRRASDLPWVSVWTSKPTVAAGMAGYALARMVAFHPRVGARGRRRLVAAYASAGLAAWPLLTAVGGWGSLEVVAIDVGQGDAILLRSPRGRWLLVDAGPSAGVGADPGAHPVVRALRARGVRRLEALVLTHADLDHIGGAADVLSALDVAVVYDPALPAGKADYAEVLDVAAQAGVPWVPARAGRRIDFDGAVVEVLHPADPVATDVETNEASVVLRVSWGAFDALLTGDAYKATERRIAGSLEGLELLKVGHHGSDTSTDSLLLAHSGARIALISVGRFNRYGHPAPEVLGRLERAGVSVYRTDESGTISIRGEPDGSFSVRTEGS